MSESGIVYCFTDHDGVVRYVGQTRRGIHERVRQHLRDCERGKTRWNRWLRVYVETHGIPMVSIVERCDPEDLDAAEAMHIDRHKETILNTIGVDGGCGADDASMFADVVGLSAARLDAAKAAAEAEKEALALAQEESWKAHRELVATRKAAIAMLTTSEAEIMAPLKRLWAKYSEDVCARSNALWDRSDLAKFTEHDKSDLLYGIDPSWEYVGKDALPSWACVKGGMLKGIAQTHAQCFRLLRDDSRRAATEFLVYATLKEWSRSLVSCGDVPPMSTHFSWSSQKIISGALASIKQDEPWHWKTTTVARVYSLEKYMGGAGHIDLTPRMLNRALKVALDGYAAAAVKPKGEPSLDYYSNWDEFDQAQDTTRGAA